MKTKTYSIFSKVLVTEILGLSRLNLKLVALHFYIDIGRVCPPDYTYGYGICYQFVSTKRTWDDASSSCDSYGHSLTIHSIELKNAVWRHTEGTDKGKLRS